MHIIILLIVRNKPLRPLCKQVRLVAVFCRHNTHGIQCNKLLHNRFRRVHCQYCMLRIQLPQGQDIGIATFVHGETDKSRKHLIPSESNKCLLLIKQLIGHLSIGLRHTSLHTRRQSCENAMCSQLCFSKISAPMSLITF